MEAEPCTCIGDKSSFVCPHCERCFCSAPSPYWKGFWAAAPQELWDRRREQQQAPAPASQPSAAAPLVLIVEDHRLTRMTALRVLESLGCRVLEATNGEQGLKLTRERRPDLVLTDALMPILDGREMCLKIKDDPQLAATRVVIMTNVYTSLAHRNEGLQRYRADAFLAKPVATSAVRDLLQRLGIQVAAP